MARILAAPSAEIRGDATPFLLGAAVGLGTALVAAWFPARLAGNISPLEGMRPAVAPNTGTISPGLLVAGLCLYAVAAVLVAASLEGFLPIALLLPSGVLVLMASVIFLAALLRPLVWGVAWLLAPCYRVESTLAGQATASPPGTDGPHSRRVVPRRGHGHRPGNDDCQ